MQHRLVEPEATGDTAGSMVCREKQKLDATTATDVSVRETIDRRGGLGLTELRQASMHIYQNRVEMLTFRHDNCLEVIPQQQQEFGPNKMLVLHLPTKLLKNLLRAHQHKYIYRKVTRKDHRQVFIDKSVRFTMCSIKK